MRGKRLLYICYSVTLSHSTSRGLSLNIVFSTCLDGLSDGIHIGVALRHFQNLTGPDRQPSKRRSAAAVAADGKPIKKMEAVQPVVKGHTETTGTLKNIYAFAKPEMVSP